MTEEEMKRVREALNDPERVKQALVHLKAAKAQVQKMLGEKEDDDRPRA